MTSYNVVVNQHRWTDGFARPRELQSVRKVYRRRASERVNNYFLILCPFTCIVLSNHRLPEQYSLPPPWIIWCIMFVSSLPLDNLYPLAPTLHPELNSGPSASKSKFMKNKHRSINNKLLRLEALFINNSLLCAQSSLFCDVRIPTEYIPAVPAVFLASIMMFNSFVAICCSVMGVASSPEVNRNT